MDINEYLGLIPFQTRTIRYPNPDPQAEEATIPSRFERFMESILQPIVDLGAMIENKDSYSIDTAVGPQLDYIGEAFGISRELSYIPTDGSRMMDDEEYRTILKMRSAQLLWDGGNKQASEIYINVLRSVATITYEDSMDGTVEIAFNGANSVRLAELIENYHGYLVPCGIGLTVTLIDDEASAEAFSDAHVTGVSYSKVISLSMPE